MKKKIQNEYKYLGVIFMTSRKNIFKNEYTYLATQARKGLYTLLKHSRPAIVSCTVSCLLKMFDSICSRPIHSGVRLQEMLFKMGNIYFVDEF